MTIEVLPKANHEHELHHISFEEAVIVQFVYDGLGKIAAVRTVRAFAKCGLLDAKNYVDTILGGDRDQN